MNKAEAFFKLCYLKSSHFTHKRNLSEAAMNNKLARLPKSINTRIRTHNI